MFSCFHRVRVHIREIAQPRNALIASSGLSCRGSAAGGSRYSSVSIPHRISSPSPHRHLHCHHGPGTEGAGQTPDRGGEGHHRAAVIDDVLALIVLSIGLDVVGVLLVLGIRSRRHGFAFIGSGSRSNVRVSDLSGSIKPFVQIPEFIFILRYARVLYASARSWWSLGIVGRYAGSFENVKLRHAGPKEGAEYLRSSLLPFLHLPGDPRRFHAHRGVVLFLAVLTIVPS